MASPANPRGFVPSRRFWSGFSSHSQGIRAYFNLLQPTSTYFNPVDGFRESQISAGDIMVTLWWSDYGWIIVLPPNSLNPLRFYLLTRFTF